MPETTRLLAPEHLLQGAARHLADSKLWRGAHFAPAQQMCTPQDAGEHFGSLSVVAAVYYAATGTIPLAFYDNDAVAVDLIRTHQPVMTALRVLSSVLPTEAPTSEGLTEPDYIEHIEHWSTSRDLLTGQFPTLLQVCGRLTIAARRAEPAVEPDPTPVVQPAPVVEPAPAPAVEPTRIAA